MNQMKKRTCFSMQPRLRRPGLGAPPYVAPGSRSPSPLALSALYHQVHGAGPRTPDTPGKLERGRRGREEEGRRCARARLLLDQERGGKESTGGKTTFRAGSRSRSRQREHEQEQAAGADTEDWVCICRLCVLYPGRPCGTNWPRRPVAKVKGDNREEESGEAEKRRCRSASTWTPPRKRSISPQGPISHRISAEARPLEGAGRSS